MGLLLIFIYINLGHFTSENENTKNTYREFIGSDFKLNRMINNLQQVIKNPVK